MYLIGIDLGTTAVKTVLFNDEGDVIQSVSSEYTTEFPTEGAAEQDPSVWWNATLNTLKKLISEQPQDRRNVAAISVSSQSPTMLPLDKNGKPLKKAMIWMDRRSDDQCKHIEEIVGRERITEITGNRADAYFMLPKLLYFRENEPELFEKTTKFLQVNGYIAYQLSGEFSIDRSSAGLTLLYDIENQNWSEELFSKLDLNASLLGPINEPHDILGKVKKSLSEEIGFKSPPMVVAGTVDGPAAALEAGVVHSKTICDMSGTSSVIQTIVDNQFTHEKLTVLPHVIPNKSLLFGSMSSTGGSLKWFRNQLGFMERAAGDLLQKDAYYIMDKEVENLPTNPTGIIYLPYLMGERSPLWDSKVRSMFFGITASTTRSHLIKAIMEGVAFGLKHNIEVLQSKGLDFNEIRSVGGGSNSDIWNQLKANVSGIPLTLPETSIGAPFGDAVVAGYACGYFSDYAEFIDKKVKVKKEYIPDPRLTEKYHELFEIYKNLYLDNKESFDKLHDIRVRLND